MADENVDGAATNEPSGDQTHDNEIVTQGTEGTENTDTEGAETTETEGDDDGGEGMSLIGKDDDETATEDKEQDGEKDNKDEPVTYEEFELPEDVDQQMLEVTTGLFAKHGLSQEAAQEIISAYAEQIKLGREAQAEAVAEAHKQWAKDMKADREFGGDKFEATAKYAQSAFKKFADEEFVQLMRDTGLEKHPAALRTFARVGRDLLEDQITDDPAINQNRSIVDDWYK